MTRLFEKYFKLPLIQSDYNPKMVWTQDENRAFDFKITVSRSDSKNIVNCLNGLTNKKIDGVLTHKGGTISLDGTEILFIRSWGRLTGVGGGLGLKLEKAAAIQDDFCEWIIEQLTKK